MLPESIAGLCAGTPPTTLVLHRLPNGEFAWLRPELGTAIRDADQVEQDLTRPLGRPEAQPAPGETRYAADRSRPARAGKRTPLWPLAHCV